MEEVLEHIEKLAAGEERLSTLSRIVGTLTGAEMEAVNRMISERRDPLHKLPFELVQAIFSYLPVYDAWRLQAVTRQWRATLACERFLSTRLTQEEASNHRDSTELTPVMSTRTMQQRIRHMQARRLGRPFRYCTLPDEISASSMLRRPGQQRTALQGHHIAYVRETVLEGSGVLLRDLRTGQSSFFMGKAREQVFCLTLTNSLLAVLTFSAILYVRQIDSPEMPSTSFRLPSINIASLAGDGDTIVMLVSEMRGGTSLVVCSARAGTLFVLDFEKQVVRSGEQTLELEPQNLLIDEKLGVADVFSYGTLPTGNEEPPRWVESHFGHARFVLDDRPSTNARPIISSSIGWTQERNIGSCGRIRYTGTDKLYRVERDMSQTDASLMFDAGSARLYVEQHNMPANAKEGGCLLRWKDVFHVVEADRRAIYTLVSREQAGRRTVKHQSSLLSAESCCGDRSTAFANESYIVNFEHHGGGINRPGCICVYCFDEDVQLADGKSTGLWADTKCSSHTISPGEAESPFMLWTPFEHKLPFQESK